MKSKLSKDKLKTLTNHIKTNLKSCLEFTIFFVIFNCQFLFFNIFIFNPSSLAAFRMVNTVINHFKQRGPTQLSWSDKVIGLSTTHPTPHARIHPPVKLCVVGPGSLQAPWDGSTKKKLRFLAYVTYLNKKIIFFFFKTPV